MPPPDGCPTRGLAYPEVTRAICLVPSASFSQAPWYALPVHLCRFRVRSIRQSCFPECSKSRVNPIRPDNISHSSLLAGWGRLTLRRLALRRNPWTFGERVSHPLCRYSCQHSHFRYLQPGSRRTFTGLRNAPLPLISEPAASVGGLSPVTFSAQVHLTSELLRFL